MNETVRNFLKSSLTHKATNAYLSRAIQLVLHRLASQSGREADDLLPQGCLLLLADILEEVFGLTEVDTLSIKSQIFKDSLYMHNLFCSLGDPYPGKKGVLHSSVS